MAAFTWPPRYTRLLGIRPLVALHAADLPLPPFYIRPTCVCVRMPWVLFVYCATVAVVSGLIIVKPQQWISSDTGWLR